MSGSLRYHRRVNVGALQFDIQWENKEANFQRVRQMLTEARPEPGTLMVLPEMFASGFSMNTEVITEKYGSLTEKFLAGLSRELGIWLIAGAAMKAADGRARNKALVFSPAGDLIAFYAKMRLFTLGGEGEHYVPGTHPVTFSWNDITVSPFICYDLRFPELFRQAAAAKRPEVYTVIASWPQKRIQHWVTLLQARAIENQAYVIGVNRIGTDPFYEYSGRSVIVSPEGTILADAGDTQGLISAAVDVAKLRKYREGLPFLADLRLQT